MLHLQSILVLIPGVVGLLWLLAYLIITPRNVFFRKLKRFIALLSLFFVFAFLSSDTESRMLLHFVLFEQVCALALVPCFISFIKEYNNSRAPGLLFKICCMIPMVHLVVGIESVYVAGFEDSLRIYLESLSFQGPMFPYLDNNGQVVVYACYTYIFKSFVLINFLLFAINLMVCIIGDGCKIKETLSFLFKGGEANPVPVLYFLSLIILLISIPALILGKSCYSGMILLTVLVSVILLLDVVAISIVGLAGAVERQSLKGILKSVGKTSSRE